MSEELSTEAAQAARRAIQLVTEALDLLDATSAPPQVSAHLELALAAMREMLDQDAGTRGQRAGARRRG